MQILQNAVVIAIKSLLAIGDATLFILASIIHLLKKIIDWIFNLVKSILRFFSRTYKRTVDTFSSFRRFRTDKILKPKIKKIKKIKPIKIFPFPFFVKAKYFLIGSLFSAIFIFLPLLFLIFIQDLPSPKILGLQKEPQTTKIYDRNGVLLYQIYASQNRTFVPLSSIPYQF